MKKYLFYLVFAGILLHSCTKEETVITHNFNETIIKSDQNTIVTKLIAAGGKYDEKCEGIEVGELVIRKEDSISVTYSVKKSGWWLSETHLYIGAEENIPATKKGNPKIGHFPYYSAHDPGTVSFTFGPFSYNEEDYVIAAHAALSFSELTTTDLNFCDKLPSTADFIFYDRGPSAYLNIEVSNGDWLDGPHPGWCVDVEDPISEDRLYTNAKVYCSIDSIPDGLVDHPENLDLVNWILNHVETGMASACDGVYTYGDIQRAIWEIIDDNNVSIGLGEWSQCRADEIVTNALLNGTDYQPGCGDNVGVILHAGDKIQTVIISVPYGCLSGGEEKEETAWAYGQNGTYCDQNGAVGISFTDSPYYGGKRWGWYFYGLR